MSIAAKPSSTHVWMEMWDSASKRKPVTPGGVNWWKWACRMVAPPASAARQSNSFQGLGLRQQSGIFYPHII